MLKDEKRLFKKIENRWMIYTLLQNEREKNPGCDEEFQMYIDIIVNGIESMYGIVYEYVGFGKDSITDEISGEVDNILKMYRSIQQSVESLQGVEQRQLLIKQNINFAGFRSNVFERKHLVYLSFLKKHQNHVLPKETESAHITLDGYRKMYQRYSRIINEKMDNHYRNLDDYSLTLHDMEYIFAAANDLQKV